MLIVSDHNKLLKDSIKRIGPITNMSKFIAEWVEKSFFMTAMMPDEPEIQANVTVLYEIENIKYQQKQRRTQKWSKSNNKIICWQIIRQNYYQKKEEVQQNHPSNFLYCSNAVQKNTKVDTYNLFKALQIHKYSAYCMRKRKYL